MERKPSGQPEFRENGLQEKCGMFAVISSQPISSEMQTHIYKALPTLEHRGNHGAGHIWAEPNTNRWFGVSTDQEVVALSHQLLITGYAPADKQLFHTRYSTTGGIGPENTQPFVVNNGPYRLALQHNGNIPETGVRALRARLLPDTTPPDASDTKVMAAYLIQERPHHSSWEETLLACLPDFAGAYSLLLLTEDGSIYAVRDPHGIRPLVYGKRQISGAQENDILFGIASESPTLEAIGITEFTDIQPGEICVFSTTGQIKKIQFAITPGAFCALEHMYFEREDSVQGGTTIREHRMALGRGMAARLKAKNLVQIIEVIVPILNSGKWAAHGLTLELQKPLIEAITRNKKDRSFIQESDMIRREVVYNKHSVSPEARRHLSGKRIALVDDSLIRGTSFTDVLAKIKGDVLSLNGNGEKFPDEDSFIESPAEIHIVLAAPPVLEICDLGIAIADRGELIVRRLLKQEHPTLLPLIDTFSLLSTDEQMRVQGVIEAVIAQHLTVNSVTFSTHTIVKDSLNTSELCLACFGGPHPIKHQNKPIFRRDYTSPEAFADAVFAHQLAKVVA